MRVSVLMLVVASVLWGGVARALTPEETFEWIDSGAGVMLTGLTDAGKALSELVIPETLGGKPVTEIKPYVYRSFYYNGNVETVVLPGTLGKLNSGVFDYCSKLQKLVFREGVTEVLVPLSGCYALERIELPATLSKLSWSVDFKRSKWPKLGFRVAEGNERFRATEDGALIGPDLYGKACCVLMFGPPKDAPYVYAVPEGVEEIGTRAFAEDVLLTAVTLPESCGVIGPYAFDACTALTRLTVTDALWHCGERSLRNCSALEGLRLPKGFRTYGPAAFDGCRSMNIDVDEGNATFRSYRGGLIGGSSDAPTLIHAPGHAEEGIYYVPQGVVGIGAEAFRDRTGVTAVVLPVSRSAKGVRPGSRRNRAFPIRRRSR